MINTMLTYRSKVLSWQNVSLENPENLITIFDQVVIEPCVTDGVEVTCTVHDITGDELLEVKVLITF